MLGGLTLFGIVFALNSSVHSYLVLAYSEADRVSLSVGFYYMANACGRLLGTLLSGVLVSAGRRDRVAVGRGRARCRGRNRRDVPAAGHERGRLERSKRGRVSSVLSPPQASADRR